MKIYSLKGLELELRNELIIKFQNETIELSINEARALRDALKKGLEHKDEELIKGLSERVETYEPMPMDTFFTEGKTNTTEDKPKEEFKLFGKDKTELYY